MEHIDVILYINLEKRDDRKQHFLQEIQKICNDPSKIVRVDAVYDTFGAIGCTKSHIKALELFLTNDAWNTCAIFEDDFTFYNESVEKNNATLRGFFEGGLSWEVLLLATNQPKEKPLPTEIEGVYKVLYTQTASGYILHKESARTMCSLFKESLQLLEVSKSVHYHAHDMYWNTAGLQWYCFQPNIGYQYAGMSDIEHTFVEYGC
jgi:GR25 family glycosyltransferase involved in LPS biosynthesis